MVASYFFSALRIGARNLVRFNAAVAVVGATTACLWNPGAPVDEIIVVVALPVILTYVGSCALRALNVTATPPTQASTSPELAKQVQANSESSLRVVKALLYSVLAISLSFGGVLAVPFYAWMDIGWAIPYALIFALVVFVLGVCGFSLALSRLVPGLGAAVMTAARIGFRPESTGRRHRMSKPMQGAAPH